MTEASGKRVIVLGALSAIGEATARLYAAEGVSPHVLVTTRHPDEPNPGELFVVSLNGLAAHDSALVVTKLADQLLVTGLSQSGLDASEGWRRVLAAVGSAISATGCYFNNVSFSFKTGVVNAEIKHSTENARC